MFNRRSGERRNIEALSRHLRWMVANTKVDDGLTIEGWALRGDGNAADARFLLNGTGFEEVEYPIASPDLQPIFWCEPSAATARFLCRAVRPREGIFPEGRATLEFLPRGERDETVDRTAWSLGDPVLEQSTPAGSNVYRVIGSEAVDKYFLGGATIQLRLERYLRQTFGRGFADFRRILDWGCGAARLTRYLPAASGTEVWGADIDAVNLEWCRANVPGARFEQLPLTPPTGLPAGAFDLIVGISVFTHLKKPVQESWLAELERIAAPGAVLLVSITGPSVLALGRFPEKQMRQLERKGFLVTGDNAQINAEDSDGHYYVDAIHTRKYVRRLWGSHFEVVDIVDALAAHQDVVVMRKR